MKRSLPLAMERATDAALNNNATRTTALFPSSLAGGRPLSYSTCSVQGERPYMEDEYLVEHEGRFAAVYDGHGGHAVR